jgi:hypothetical protein
MNVLAYNDSPCVCSLRQQTSKVSSPDCSTGHYFAEAPLLDVGVHADAGVVLRTSFMLASETCVRARLDTHIPTLSRTSGRPATTSKTSGSCMAYSSLAMMQSSAATRQRRRTASESMATQ